MQHSITQKTNNAFELKGSLFTLTVLHLLQADIHAFTAQLRWHAQKTPNLFKNMPVIIDLQRLGHSKQMLDFVNIQYHLRQYGLIPVGIRHGSEQQNNAAQIAGLALISSKTNTSSSPVNKPKAKIATDAEANTSTLLNRVITKPVRSGQQVYAKKANLVVLSSVGHGAELLADGCIHVYGSLRGRALAGITGDKSARIFCQKLEAELVSIAGYYKLNTDMPDISTPITQVHLVEDSIHIEGIS